MAQYKVTFEKGNKTHKVTVKAQGLVPAIETAVRKHFEKYIDALGYEITAAEKISE